MFKIERQEQYEIEIDYPTGLFSTPFKVWFRVVGGIPVLRNHNGIYSLFELEQMVKLLKKKTKEYEKLNE